MDHHVDLGTRRTFSPSGAVLLYTEDALPSMRHRAPIAYATVHDILPPTATAAAASEPGTPQLGPGEPVNSGFLRGLLEGLGRDLKPEFLPDNVLYRTHEVVVWWTPAAKRTLFFREGSELGDLDAEDFWTPALVWKLYRRNLYVRALLENARPLATTPLFVAPFWNTNADTARVCEGTMQCPNASTVATLQGWVDGYFRSAFTHQDGTGALTAHPGGFTGLWREHAGGRKRFKPAWLTPTRPRAETVAAFAGVASSLTAADEFGEEVDDAA